MILPNLSAGTVHADRQILVKPDSYPQRPRHTSDPIKLLLRHPLQILVVFDTLEVFALETRHRLLRRSAPVARPLMPRVQAVRRQLLGEGREDRETPQSGRAIALK